jgi:hypothetical protein
MAERAGAPIGPMLTSPNGLYRYQMGLPRIASVVLPVTRNPIRAFRPTR